MGDYITRANLKARYLPDKGTEDDAVLDAYITTASRIVDAMTGRGSWDLRAGVTKTLDGSGSPNLFLADTLVTLTQARIRDGMQSAWRVVTLTDVLLEPADRRPGEPALWLRITDVPAGSDVRWPKGARTCEITGDWGRATVRADIEEATAEIVLAMYRARGSGLENESVAGLANTFVPRALPALAHRLLSMSRSGVTVFV